jgi:hypothetical protein
MFESNTPEVITRGLALLREGRFFDAHECFEDAWRISLGHERTLFHALAQLSACYHQLALGRAQAAVRTWLKAREKLAAIGALSTEYQRGVEAFWARIGAGLEGPRRIAVEHLPPRDEWPLPEYLLPFVSA